MEENIKIKVQMEQDEASFNEVVDGMRKKIKEIYAPADRIREENELKRLDKRFGLDKGPSRDDLRREKDERKRAQQEEIEHVKNLGRERQKAEKELAALKKRDLEEQTEMSKRALQDGQKKLNDITAAYQAAAGGIPPSGVSGFFKNPMNLMAISGLAQGGGNTINAINYSALAGSQIRGATERANNYFNLGAAQGDYSKYLYADLIKQGSENAPSKLGMLGSDVLGGLGEIAGIGAGFGMMGTGVGSLAGMGTAGYFGSQFLNRITPENTNYFQGLEKRSAEATLAAQQAAIGEDPIRKQMTELMIASGSTRSTIESRDFMASLAKSSGVDPGIFGGGAGKLSSGMTSEQLNKTTLQNLTAAVALGMDQSHNAKEMTMFLQSIADRQMEGGARTAEGAKNIGDIFSSSFANTQTMAGMQSGNTINDMMNRITSGSDNMNQALKMKYFQKSPLNDVLQRTGLASRLAMIPRDEINVDNQVIQSVAAESGGKLTPQQVVDQTLKANQSIVGAVNAPRVKAAQEEREKRKVGPYSTGYKAAADVQLALAMTTSAGEANLVGKTRENIEGFLKTNNIEPLVSLIEKKKKEEKKNTEEGQGEAMGFKNISKADDQLGGLATTVEGLTKKMQGLIDSMGVQGDGKDSSDPFYRRQGNESEREYINRTKSRPGPKTGAPKS